MLYKGEEEEEGDKQGVGVGLLKAHQYRKLCDFRGIPTQANAIPIGCTIPKSINLLMCL